MKSCAACGRSDIDDGKNICPNCQRPLVGRGPVIRAAAQIPDPGSDCLDRYPCGHDLVPGQQRCHHCEEETQALQIRAPWGDVSVPDDGLLLGRDPSFSPHAVELAHWDNVSRRHAILRLTPEGIVVEDCGSTNGTFIDESQVTASTPIGQRTAIAGSVIRLGCTPPVEFRVYET
jgi:hypothetical protein